MSYGKSTRDYVRRLWRRDKSRPALVHKKKGGSFNVMNNLAWQNNSVKYVWQ